MEWTTFLLLAFFRHPTFEGTGRYAQLLGCGPGADLALLKGTVNGAELPRALMGGRPNWVPCSRARFRPSVWR